MVEVIIVIPQLLMVKRKNNMLLTENVYWKEYFARCNMYKYTNFQRSFLLLARKNDPLNCKQ